MSNNGRMKRVFDEISDDEWDSHSFQPSRVLKTTSLQKHEQKKSAPPSIESFAFNKRCGDTLNCSSSSEDDSIEITPPFTSGDKIENLEDDDVELDDDDAAAFEEGVPRQSNRGRRFVVDDDEEEEEEQVESDRDFAEVYDLNTTDEEEEKLELEEDDVVGKALQKCAKISADLKKELYGSAATSCERYAEVDASSVRIVTQSDIAAACTVVDSDFQPVLKPYQLVGVNFLLLLNRKGIAGAILADEMGLGKTIQAITYLMLLKHLNDDPGPHLIVCPASVLENWERELKKWCPSFSVLQYHGAARAAYSKELNSLAKAGLPLPFNVLLVCYSLFERHSAQQKDDRKILKRWRWSCVLMDEAHALKDKNSYRWKNLMSVARNAKQRLMLTGTPLQNDLHELWSLLEFMMPDLFATEDVDLKKLLNAEDRDLIVRMKSILGPFILRRLKSDVMQQLVPKIQRVEYVSMEKHQEVAYKEAIEEYRTASRDRMAKLKDINLNTIFEFLPRRQVSNYFVQFRKIANHPLLVRRIYSDEDVVRFAKILHPIGVFGFECTLDRVIEELKSYNDFSIHQLLLNYGDKDAKGILSEKHIMLSAKCRALAELLPELRRDGHKVLIFSQWTSMLDILEWTLDVIGLTYRRLDGSTPVTERQTIVDAFNNDTSIFACLLSTRAGGQGLNLTGADTVVIHDMDFNPQIDRQAEDRCHRIGQTKPVTIYRLVTKGTVDENIYEIAKRKLTLDAAVLESGVEVDDAGDTSEKTMGEILSSLLMG
ncbi:protein CHROMATIN REMODELING 19 [Ricinus communis]|uniref:protein CHROMATIN REMODELING 19 n=1 Tax=Ricinus communis TaxID=3988 RepID=UPI00201B04D5|nr:protein CHROMATIN REMODELING 19 [Ricinus communis]